MEEEIWTKTISTRREKSWAKRTEQSEAEQKCDNSSGFFFSFSSYLLNLTPRSIIILTLNAFLKHIYSFIIRIHLSLCVSYQHNWIIHLQITYKRNKFSGCSYVSLCCVVAGSSSFFLCFFLFVLFFVFLFKFIWFAS